VTWGGRTATNPAAHLFAQRLAGPAHTHILLDVTRASG
jgi:hypothetical protein